MKAIAAKYRLLQAMQQASGFEPHRKYLGMSQISGCPLSIYRSLMHGRFNEAGDERTVRRMLRGMLFEADTIKHLTAAGVYRPDSAREIIAAGIDDRLRGHTDGATVDGDLVEIKSINHEDFERIVATRKPLGHNLAQVQLYMRFGGYSHALLVYVSTETYEFFLLDVYPNARTQDQLIAKAQMILAAVDGGPQPVCMCGHCLETRRVALLEGAQA